MPFIKRLLMYLTSFIALRKEDIWLPSFPRAGSTWVRFLFSNLISLSELDGQIVDYIFVAENMPSLGRSNLFKSWNYKSLPRFIKTHRPHYRFLFDTPERVFYIIRDPRDIMVSFFHYRKAIQGNPFQGGFTEFVRHPQFGLRACISHYVSWLPYITHLICYEKMKQDTSSELSKTIHKLGLQIHEENIDLAVKRSSLKNMKTFQKNSGLANPQSLEEGFLVARKGEINQWSAYFSNDDIRLYRQICEELTFRLYD